MRDNDDLAFAAIFAKLRTIFPLRGDHGEIQQIVASYFRVLMKFPLRAVEAGADKCLETCQHFPKPMEWLKNIPRQQSASYPPLVEPEASEQRRAIALHYEDEPCTCHLCNAAGVTHRLLRFVPDEDRDGNDLRMLLDGKVVVCGHWVHGEELKRWYAARDAFHGLQGTFAGKLPRRMKSAPVEQEEAIADADA